MAVLRAVKKAEPDTAVILMTGFGNMEGAIEAIQEGAFDYVSKPFKMDDLKSVMGRAAKHWESLRQAKAAGTGAGPAAGKMEVSARGIIGKSPKISLKFTRHWPAPRCRRAPCSSMARAARVKNSSRARSTTTGRDAIGASSPSTAGRSPKPSRERTFWSHQRIFHRRDERQAGSFRGSIRGDSVFR